MDVPRLQLGPDLLDLDALDLLQARLTGDRFGEEQERLVIIDRLRGDRLVCQNVFPENSGTVAPAFNPTPTVTPPADCATARLLGAEDPGQDEA